MYGASSKRCRTLSLCHMHWYAKSFRLGGRCAGQKGLQSWGFARCCIFLEGAICARQEDFAQQPGHTAAGNLSFI